MLQGAGCATKCVGPASQRENGWFLNPNVPHITDGDVARVLKVGFSLKNTAFMACFCNLLPTIYPMFLLCHTL